MVPREFESLLYFRRFSNNQGYAAAWGLFTVEERTSGYFPAPGYNNINWEYWRVFRTAAYSEPLECVHARRTAFGGSEIRIDENRRTPDRSLIFLQPNQAMQAIGHLRLRWCVSGVLEVPNFCISSALSDSIRLKFGVMHEDGLHQIEMLRAATTLQPGTFDVFGFYVPGKSLYGAIEIVEHLGDDQFDSHAFHVSSDDKLEVGDELWGWHVGKIGEARIEARRLMAIVAATSDRLVPALLIQNC